MTVERTTAIPEADDRPEPARGLAASDLTAAYGSHRVLDGLDLSLPPGGFTVIIGANACGKSTLLRTLGRLLRPRGGAVRLDGRDIADLDTKVLARRLGVLPQTPHAPDELTVADLVTRGRQPHQSWWRQWSEADERAVDRAMELADVAALAGRPVEALSGGQRQRVWIAMVLAQETELLLLDEPTTFLDLAHRVEVLRLIRRLNDTEGRTVIAVLHDVNEACRFADHLVAMRDGRVIAQGDPRTIVTAELVRDVFGLGCAVVECPITGGPLVIPLDTDGLVDEEDT